MNKYNTIVIGGGAAGICAAISAARSGKSVVICEKMPQLGKKILASGNGRCNLLNENFDETFYNPVARPLVKSILAKFDKAEILAFFHELGLETWSQNARIFPITNQAASVLKVLEMELNRLSVPVEYDFDCSSIVFSGGHIVVSAKNGTKLTGSKLIITGGGKTYPVLGSDGTTFEIAQRLGHTIVEPVPGVVPLVIKDAICHFLQGQRIFAAACAVFDGKKSTPVKGELLFTKYGLSGTCILDISDEISIAINRDHKKDVFISVDLVPYLDQGLLQEKLAQRPSQKLAPEEMLVGLLPNKLCVSLKGLFENDNIDSAVVKIKDFRFRVSGTRGWNEAEFTIGGINAQEVNPGTLESKIRKNVYFAGEVLDVNGKRGGYNLGWAWASGYIAGQTL